MIFPIRTDRRLQHTPWVNLTLIAINVLVFAADRAGLFNKGPFLLEPMNPRVYQFITYQFLHADIWHIGGNMLFLYIFGNSVEDRLGKLGYPFFYLAGGIVAGLVQGSLKPNPALGASGSIAAVTGAYLALFPMSNVTLVYVIGFIGAFELSSVYVILLQIIQDFVQAWGGKGGVAYFAHLGGYTFGFTIGMGLLAVRLLPREPYDLLSMFEHQRRRAEFDRLTRTGYRPWEHNMVEPGGKPAKPATPQEQRIMELRSQIAAALSARQPAQAARLYEELLTIGPAQVMGQQQQLDVANYLMQEARYATAARAYELFLETFRAYPQREQIELILGLIYAKYISQPARAGELLRSALPRLRDPSQKELAQQMLAEMG